MFNNLPIYYFTIDGEGLQVDKVSLVDNPAIKKEFHAFSSQEFVEPNKNESKDSFLQRCISYVIGEGKESEQAVAICNSIWEQHFATKISFDYDGVLSTDSGKEKAKNAIANGADVYIISARDSKDGMLKVADELGIPHDKIFATGDNKAKVAKVIELGITKHYDNNPDVIKELSGIGSQFEQFKFSSIDEDRHIISGALMLADTPIYRNDPKRGEFYAVFTKQSIEDIAIQFFDKGFQNNVNLQHEDGSDVSGLVMFESFICDKSRGIMPMKGFEDVNDGSWFGSFKVNNPEVWKLIKDGKIKGFSVEGMFSLSAEKFMDELERILSCIE